MTGKADGENHRITHAKLDWNAPDQNGQAPRSIFFDDIYFSGDGPPETRHVFLAANDLPARFEKAKRFAIGELGFGSGLNFLTVWDAWRRSPKPHGAKLAFFSVEKYPMTVNDLTRAHKAWPEFASLSKKLIALYPPAVAGSHQLCLDGETTLILGFGEAAEILSRADAKIDAWFLDGFAPAKNPDMWRPEVFTEMARLSRIGATYSTFTVAGAVRRALDDAGFSAEKHPGYGRKREMLAGRLKADGANQTKRAPWFSRTDQRFSPGGDIAIVGGGVAGAALARGLTRAGYSPVIFDPNGLAAGASGNPVGLIMPRLDLGDTAAARFFLSAYLHALRTIEHLQTETGETFFNSCGVLLAPKDDDDEFRQEKLYAEGLLPGEWIERRADGLFFPQAGVIDPPQYVRALAADTPVVSEYVSCIEDDGDGMRIITPSKISRRFDAVILANGVEALSFQQTRTLPLSAVAGQIDYFPNSPAPGYAIAAGPYAAPASAGGGLVIGATYDKIDPADEPSPSREATVANIEAAKDLIAEIAEGLTPGDARPRASTRCQTPDRLPVAGPLPDWRFYGGAYDGLRIGRKKDYPPGKMQDGIFILAGLGSRGLVTAPLLAAMIVAEIAGDPAPVDHEIAETVHPARFFIRDLKRAKPGKPAAPLSG